MASEPPFVSSPLWSVQHDWKVDVEAKKGTFWVSARPLGSSSVHGNVKVKGDTLEGLEGFSATKHPNTSLSFELKHEEFPSCHVFSPTATIQTPSNIGVNSTAFSPGGELVAVAADSGYLAVYSTSTYKELRRMKGHVSAVQTCRFFPSGEVLLSGGADMRLRIWSVATGECPVTLTGHGKGITGLGMIDRGRNIVSSSRDGSIKLWDCGTATCIATLSVSSEPVHDMALLNAPALAQQEGHNPPHEHEVETQGHVVVACTSDNAVLCDVRARSTVQTAEFASPFACLSPSASMGGMGLVTGHETGHVCMWDMRQLSTPVSVYQQWEARITSISATSPYNATFMASTNEGTCFGVDLETCTSTLLTGPELDPLTQLTATEELLATSCRDGAVRFYKSNPHPVVDQL
eukprot:m.40629 g.40629  ORF g.40629 m.40629 type:complete len:406 (+) comp10451_c0_seq2:231-1448(+)